jgi:hypothetical protein
MALVWIYGHRKKAPLTSYLPWKEASFFLAILIIFSYLEEGIWDVFIWKDHTSLFPFFTQLPRPDLWVVSILVPLLSLPQITHYIIDGFIWRVRSKTV